MDGSRKQNGGLILAVLLIAAAFILGETSLSSAAPVRGALLLLAALVMWATEAIPMSITTMFMICLIATMNIMSFNEAIANIGVNTSLFIMASSGITIAIGQSGIPRVLTGFIVARTKGHARKMVIGIGFLVALCSAFMSSLATCALFGGILLSMLRENRYQPGKSNLGKCFMIAVPACAGIGGFMSPAGTPANILLMDILRDNGVSVSFGQWCMAGFPVGLLATGIFLVSLVLMIPPEPFVAGGKEDGEPHGRLNRGDKTTIVIVSCIIVLWFLSTWVKTLNTTMIAVIGLFVMFLPGVRVMDWKRFSGGVNWDLVLTMGTVSVFMTGIAKTGLMSRISTAVLDQTGHFPVLIALIVISATICIIRSFVPTTTAVVALLAPMLTEISVSLGVPLVSLMFILAFWTASALLIVFTEPIYLITYGNRYYTGRDLLKAGAVPCLILAVITAAAIPALVTGIL